ncbi:MAG: hypothetical protein ACTHK6_12440 [Solirubrobacterales bacterium]
MISLGFVIACAMAIVLLVKGLYPTDLPESRNPDFIDNVFDTGAFSGRRDCSSCRQLPYWLLAASSPSSP